MAESVSSAEIGDQKKAARTVIKHGPRIDGPIERFNLGLPGPALVEETKSEVPHATSRLGWEKSWRRHNPNPDITFVAPTNKEGVKAYNNLKIEKGEDPDAEEEPIPLSPDSKPSLKLLEESKQPVMLTDPASGQNFESRVLNGDQLTSGQTTRVVIYIPEYNTPIGKGPYNARLKQLALQLGCPVVGLGLPYVGKSAGLTDLQKVSMEEDHSYKSVAEAQLRALKELGINEVDVVGMSMGGWAAAGMGASQVEGIKVNKVVCITPAGVAELPVGELKRRERGEGKYLDIYQSAPYTPDTRESSGQNSPLAFKKWMGIGRWVATHWANDPKSIFSRAMAAGKLEDDIRMGLQANPDLQVSYTYNTFDQVSPVEANRAIVGSLEEEFSGRFKYAVRPGAHHAGFENSVRFASYVASRLTGSHLPPQNAT